MSIDPVLEAKLRAIADRDDIYRVIQRYCRGVDRLDAEILRSCYFDDAIDDHGRFVGKAADFIAWAMSALRHLPMMQHAIVSFNCELEGDDAHVESGFMCTTIAPEPPHGLAIGRYIDHFQRRDGVWRIASRVAVVERNLELIDSSRFPSRADGPHPLARDRTDISYQRPVRPRAPLAD